VPEARCRFVRRQRPPGWSTPFQTIDPFQAIPVCKEALRRLPDDAGLKLATAFAYIAGRKNDQAKPLLDELVAQNNGDAMLALAFISKAQRQPSLCARLAKAATPQG
jgi:thioredoxin-like negative regulator of GroEL